MARDPFRLDVFRLAHQLTLDVYRLTGRLPTTEQFGLVAQLRRAAVSIPTNIVEGCSRRAASDYRRFIDIAFGSASETRYLLRLVVDLGLVAEAEAAGCCECSDHVVRVLQNLRRAVGRFVDEASAGCKAAGRKP
jgi:four helix bundle protein